jgi:hypothetical protein
MLTADRNPGKAILDRDGIAIAATGLLLLALAAALLIPQDRHVRQPRAVARASPAGGLASHTRRRRAAHTPAQGQTHGAEGGRVVRPPGARECRHRRARRRCRMLSALSRHSAGDELRHRSGRVLPAGSAAVRTFAVIGHGRRHARRDGLLLDHAPTRDRRAGGSAETREHARARGLRVHPVRDDIRHTAGSTRIPISCR